MKADDRGVTLLETMLAVLVAIIGAFAIGSVIFVATATTKNEGTETTRATIYAQDKMEKLLSLSAVPVSGVTTAGFANCTQPASTQFSSYPDCNTTGISASGWATGLLAGGATSPLQNGCPSGSSVGYMDFLDASGSQLTGSGCSAATASGFAYVRMWQIQDANTFGSTPALKEISVAVYSLAALGTSAAPKPIVVLTSFVSDPD
ncbi:MAG TPA: hypothetical protein VGW33_11040 [Terriglobia bacterium]|nr:hypothetical protein [Terriglobia bacterium]